jgi:hypothetical protein
MQRVKMLSDIVDVARRAADRWYVTTGQAAVGPVNLDLLARGVEAGKVPVESFVRHEEWTVWRPLSEVAEILCDDDRETPVLSASRELTDDISEVGRPSTPIDFSPSDAIDGAADRREALVLVMTAAVVRGAADAAIVHEVEDYGAVVVCAHGASIFDTIGARTPLHDPALVAAAAGATVVAEPSPGPAGASILARLSKLAAEAPVTLDPGVATIGSVGAKPLHQDVTRPAVRVLDGALMIPIRPHGRLAGLLEIGRRTPFRSAEIASIEALVEALVHKLEGWGPGQSSACPSGAPDDDRRS